MKRSLGLSAVAFWSAIALAACSTGGNEAEDPQPSSVSTTASAEETDKVLGVGDSFDVPCGFNDDSTCMTVDITDIEDDAHCENAEPKKGKFVAIAVSASMPEEASAEFSSPFSAMPWKASTPENKMSKVMNEINCDDASYLSFMDEFPGYSADGTAFVDVPEDTNMIHFKAADDLTYKIEVEGKKKSEKSSADKKTATKARATTGGQDNQQGSAPQPAPPQETQEAQPTQPPAQPQRAQEEKPEEEPVIGFTQAPGQEAPHPLDKQVASCGDPSIHEPGTTFFTDGTSGWTQQCASQMGF